MKKVVIGKVEFTGSKIHGMGGFAGAKIRKGEQIIEYVGEKMDKKESERRCIEEDNRYVFEIDDEHDIDGNVDWNPARWFNHSCDPNAETDIIDGHVYISALRKIKSGEEITYNYNFDLEEYDGYPCNCGKKRCIGYILDEEYWPKLKKLEKKKTVAEKKSTKSEKKTEKKDKKKSGKK